MALDYHSVDGSTTISSGNNPGIDDAHRMWHIADLEIDETLLKKSAQDQVGTLLGGLFFFCHVNVRTLLVLVIIRAVRINLFLWLSTFRVKTKQNRTSRNRWCKNICLNLLFC